MSINIHSNTYADYALRQLQSNYSRLNTSVKRLSSGLRISSSSDSPTGKAMRDQLRAEISSLNKGIQNAEIAVSSVQTADAAIGEINTNLYRMKELAQEAANGTYTDQQRVIINSEFQSLASEIDRIAKDTDFTGTKMLDGSVSTNVPGAWYINEMELQGPELPWPNGKYTSDDQLKVHVGSSNSREEDYYYVNLSDVTMDGLFSDYINPDDPESDSSSKVVGIDTQGNAMRSLEMIDTALERSTQASSHLGAAQNRLEASISHMQTRAEQIQGAESTISDVDVAAEMADYTKSQIMTQAAVSIVGQANALPQIALKLLA